MLIEKECYNDPWTFSHFLYEVHNPHSISYVALSENENIMGYIITHHIIENISVLNLAVNNDFRRKGVATKLLHQMYLIARNENVLKIDLEVRESNSDAISLYKRENFIISGERKNFYSDGETAIIMYKEFF